MKDYFLSVLFFMWVENLVKFLSRDKNEGVSMRGILSHTVRPLMAGWFSRGVSLQGRVNMSAIPFTSSRV